MDVTRLESTVNLAPPPPPRPANGGVLAAPALTSEPRQVDLQVPGYESLRRAVAAVNTSIASHMRHLSINFHEATGRHMVTVYDSETNQAIREIPPEKVLDAHASILELAGLFVDRRG